MPITVVQSKSGAGSSLSFNSPTTAGNCVVVVVCDSSSGLVVTTTAVTLGGSAGNFGSSPALLAGGSSASNCMASFWVDRNCAGGQTAVAATITNVNDPVLHIYELNNVDQVSPLDLAVGATTTTSSSFSSGSSGTPNFANEILIGAVCVRVSLGSVGSVSGFTNLTQNGSSTTKSESGYVIETTATAQTYTSTISTSSPHAAGILSLKFGLPATNFAPTTPTVPLNTSSPYPLNIVAGSYKIVPQNPAKIPDLQFNEPNTATVTVTAFPGTTQNIYPSSPQFPIPQLQSFPPNLRLPVFTPTPPSSSKAGVTITGLTATVTVTANTGSEAVNYPSSQQFPMAKNTPWPLPVVAPNLTPQHSGQSRTYVAGVKASVTVTAQTGSATPNVAGQLATVSVSANLGTEFTRINYAVPFPFTNYPYPLNLISGVRPQNPTAKPGTFVTGLTATVTINADPGLGTALYPVTPQFPFTNLALPLTLRKLRQQNFTAAPQHSFQGALSTVAVAANTGIVTESPHGNVSAVTVTARTGVTKVAVSESPANIAIVSFAKTTASIRGNVSNITVAARFGSPAVSVSAHGSVTVTPRFGSPNISVNGFKSSVAVAAVIGRTNVSPHGAASGVAVGSAVRLGMSVTEPASSVASAALSGSPRMAVSDATGRVSVKAYIEGVAFAGSTVNVTVSPKFGSISISLSEPVSGVAVRSYNGTQGESKLIGHMTSLHWSAELIPPTIIGDDD